MSIWQEVTKDVKSVVHPGPDKFVAGGQPVRCGHCQADAFIEGSAVVSTVGMSFAHLTWATEKQVATLMCDNCGLIQWFGAAPQRHHAGETRQISLEVGLYDDELA